MAEEIDAQRYRWFRAFWLSNTPLEDIGEDFLDARTALEFDAAIDRAMLAAPRDSEVWSLRTRFPLIYLMRHRSAGGVTLQTGFAALGLRSGYSAGADGNRDPLICIKRVCSEFISLTALARPRVGGFDPLPRRPTRGMTCDSRGCVI